MHTNSKEDKRVERVSVSDEPHERYRKHDPWTGKHLDTGIPILNNTSHGNVVEKDVSVSIIRCPECEIPARYTHKSEPVCPQCGLICGSSAEKNPEVVLDPKAAGRVD
jgi:hypothetical protein